MCGPPKFKVLEPQLAVFRINSERFFEICRYQGWEVGRVARGPREPLASHFRNCHGGHTANRTLPKDGGKSNCALVPDVLGLSR